MPVVTVIVPMRNAALFIRATLASLRQQQLASLEIIVVDDGSTDGSAAIVQACADHRVRLITGPQQGIAAAFNAGLAQAQGNIIMRCDADDCYPADKIIRQVQWLAKHPECIAVCGNFSTLNVQGKLIRNMNCGRMAEDITVELQQGHTRTHFGTFAVRANALKDLGGCRSYFLSAEDIDLQFRLGEYGRIWYLPQIAYAYRIHDNSFSHSMSIARRQFFDQIARTFQKQRQQNGRDDLQNGCPPTPPAHTSQVRTAREHIQGLLLGLAWQEHQQGNHCQALKTGWQSVKVRPANITAWRSLAALALKSTDPKFV